MANHKSAEKRNRQNIKKRLRNRQARAAVRTAIKKARAAATNGEKDLAKELLLQAERTIAKAATKGLYHRNNASRKISRLAQFVLKTTAA